MKTILRIIAIILLVAIAYINVETNIQPTSKLIITIALGITIISIYFLEDTIVNHFRGKTHINGNNARKDAINDKYSSNKVNKRYDNPEIISNDNINIINHGVGVPIGNNSKLISIDRELINRVNDSTIIYEKHNLNLKDYKDIKAILGVKLSDFIENVTWFTIQDSRTIYGNDKYIVIKYVRDAVEIRKCK